MDHGDEQVQRRHSLEVNAFWKRPRLELSPGFTMVATKQPLSFAFL
jgi:hypothetical protein